MAHFITETERNASHSTCYFEFQKGRHKGKFWEADSICLHINTFNNLDLYTYFATAVPGFDYYGITQVTQAQYAVIKTAVLDHGGEAAVAIAELDTWVQECFQREDCFSVLGI